MFEYETYLIQDSKNNERTIGKIYFCYFEKDQKIKFEEFYHYYENYLAHGKSIPEVTFIDDITIIRIEYGG